mmetsp:Transcript_17091/g.66562  ORF Transcript_17091/g.66562 Transcript_17091/m.66562 type:complete len:479 (+) Transcript_17091:35-1471(+)
MVLLIILMQFPFMVGYGSMMLISGFLFGFVGGLTTLVIGCQIGLLFVGGCSRYFFREKSQEYINKNAYVQALVEELLQHQVKFSVLVRVTPLPVGLQNVLLAVNIPVWLYVTSSFFGMLIEQIPMVYIGTTAKNLAEVIAGDVEVNPVQFLVIGISGAGILIVGVVLFWVSRNALKKVKQRQADMETETAEEGEEAVDLEELYDAEEADNVLDLDLGMEEEEWDELEMGMALGVASYAGAELELEKGTFGKEEEVKADHDTGVLLHSVSSGEQLSEMEKSAMVTVSSGEQLCDMDPGMVVEQELVMECGDDQGDTELRIVDEGGQQAFSSKVGAVDLDLGAEQRTSDAESSLEFEEDIGLTPPRVTLARKTSTEVKAELSALQSNGSTDNLATNGAESPDFHRRASPDMLEDLEMFGDDDDTEAMLDADDEPGAHSAKATRLARLKRAAMKPLAKRNASKVDSTTSLMRVLTEDEEVV